MATKLTFNQACDAWDGLMDRPDATATDDGRLLEACERIILDQPVNDHRHAARICAVLADDLACGPRSDGRDVRAVTRLQLWLIQQDDRLGIQRAERGGDAG